MTAFVSSKGEIQPICKDRKENGWALVPVKRAYPKKVKASRLRHLLASKLVNIKISFYFC